MESGIKNPKCETSDFIFVSAKSGYFIAGILLPKFILASFRYIGFVTIAIVIILTTSWSGLNRLAATIVVGII